MCGGDAGHAASPFPLLPERILLDLGFPPKEARMAGKSIKNKPKYRALKRKGMSKSRAARISNAGKSASRKGGRKGGKKKS
jgi:hypothetical protein